MNKKSEETAARDGGVIEVPNEPLNQQELTQTIHRQFTDNSQTIKNRIEFSHSFLYCFFCQQQDKYMANNKLLTPQLKDLLSNVSNHGNQHLLEIEVDLIQTENLLGEAIDKLVNSFISINEAVNFQQEAVNVLLVGKQISLEDIVRLKKIHEEVGIHVNEAVTSMQFQDMTNQLIGRAVKRVVGLRDALALLGNTGAQMFPENGGEEIIAFLSRINNALVIRNIELEGALRKVVHQSKMDSGDIELF